MHQQERSGEFTFVAVPCLLKVINADSVVGCIIPASMCAHLYSALIVQALAAWGERKITLIEDTSLLWDEYCLIRLSVQYRGRAIPSSVASDSSWQ